MGRYKKGVKLVRSDLWEKVGGTDFIVKKLLNADILNRNTAKSSDLWSQLAIDLFNDDTPRNRAWIWENWRINRQGIGKEYVWLQKVLDGDTITLGEKWSQKFKVKESNHNTKRIKKLFEMALLILSLQCFSIANTL